MMERKRTVTETPAPSIPAKPRWKKIGGGSFRLSNLRMIRSGQIFEAYEHEIPQAFRDVVIALDPKKEPTPEEVVKKEEQLTAQAKLTNTYTLKPRAGGGWYDVVDANGKIMNTKALKEDAALEMIKNLE